MNRIGDPYNATPEVRAMGRLHATGWSVGVVADRDEADRPCWLGSGFNGENLVRAWASTMAEVWAAAEEQTRTLGMLGQS